MANIKSAKKRIKTNERDREKNANFKTEIKTLQKKVEKALKDKAEDKDTLLKLYISRVDSMVAKGIFKKNKAARLKSRTTKK